MTVRYRCFIFSQVGIQLSQHCLIIFTPLFWRVFLSQAEFPYCLSVLFYDLCRCVIHYCMIKAVLCFGRTRCSCLHLYFLFFSFVFIPFPAWLFFYKSFGMSMYNFRKRLISIFIGIVLNLKLAYLHNVFFQYKNVSICLILLQFKKCLSIGLAHLCYVFPRSPCLLSGS